MIRVGRATRGYAHSSMRGRVILTARVSKALILGVLAAFVAMLTVGSASAATTPNVHKMYVNPISTPAPDAGVLSDTGNYGLRTCQTQQTAFGACYDPYQMRHAYGVDSL